MYIFSVSLLLFWLRGRVEIDSKFVKLRLPNIVFRFFPMGSTEDIIPLRNVSNLQINTDYRLLRMIFGGLMALGSLMTLLDGGLGSIINFFFWLFVAGSGIRNSLTFDKSGSQQRISVPFYEQNKLYAIKDELHARLSEFEDRSDLGLYFDRKQEIMEEEISIEK